jgi:glycosyltransferase involved in cell wall biosynthesis
VKLSIALCTYNGAEFLPEQLGSIAKQTRPPDELVICDDCSTDETRRVVTSFAANAPFAVVLHVNEVNLGSTKNFEKAVSLCTGDIIALSDQDDVWLPNKLERLEKIFSESPEVGIVFTDAELVDEKLVSKGERLWECTLTPLERQLFEAGRAFDALLRYNVVTGATMAFQARFRELVLPVPHNTYLIHDGWIALMIATVAPVVAVPESLIKYRQHPGQQLGVNQRRGLRIQTVESIDGRAKRQSYYTGEIKKIDDVKARLRAVNNDPAGNPDYFVTADRILLMDDLRAHYCVRGRLPESRLRRVPLVMREMASGRYARFSKGVASALKDLLR